MMLVDLDRPHLQPFYGDVASLVHYARILRAGERRDGLGRARPDHMRDGKISGIDAEAALAEVKARAPHWGALMQELGVSRLPACPCGAH